MRRMLSIGFYKWRAVYRQDGSLVTVIGHRLWWKWPDLVTDYFHYGKTSPFFHVVWYEEDLDYDPT